VAELIELAERCEKAVGPDRGLDGLIMAALYRREDRMIGTQEEQDDGSWAPIATPVWVDPASGQWLSTGALEFTSSIDAAMTLPPSNLWLTLDRYVVSDQPEPNTRTWRVWLKGLVGDIEGDGQCGRVEYFATGAVPSLAIAAASLKARAALQEARR
jgi:hypothetical protein